MRYRRGIVSWLTVQALCLGLALPSSSQAQPPSPPDFGVTASDDTPTAELASLLGKSATEQVPLLAGLNLISISEEPADTDPAAVFAAVAGRLHKVTAHDACDTADPWKVYDPSDPAASDLTAVDHKIGMWVSMTATSALPLDGVLPATTTLELCEGWNLIGFPAGEPRHPYAALSSIAGKWQRIFGYDALDPEDPWEYFDPAVPAWANDLEVMKPGRGYWVLVNEAVSLEISNQGPPPTIAIATPADLAVVTQPTPIIGTVESDRLESWTLTAARVGDGEAVTLATGNAPISGGTLATFDPTHLLNGLYKLELTATDVQGQQVTDQIAVSIEGQMKIGHFTLSFVDLAVPVAGLDLEILRTYDSRENLRRDFGVGWDLEIRQGSYRNNRPPGDGWQFQTGLVACDTALESKSHLTVVRLSDREIYRFALRLYGGEPRVGGGCQADARFDFIDGPLPGTTLEIQGQTQVFWETGSDQAIDVDTFETYEPEDVRLRTRDGRIFDLDLHDGVTRVEDLNGNQLAITPAGISHSSGDGIIFERDTEGRITRIIDPLANALVYTYDSEGNLESVLDRVGQLTRFAYHPDHLLHKILLPDDREILATEYDGDGRLVRQCTHGACLSRASNRDASQEIWTDVDGSVTTLTYDARGNVTALTETGSDGAQRTYQLEYDDRDRVIRLVDPLGDVTVKTYDEGGNLASVTLPMPAGSDPEDFTTRFTYDAGNRLTSASFPSGLEFSAQYDSRGNLLRLEDDEGRLVERHTYLPNGTVTSTTDAFGTFIYDGFDAAGRAGLITDARGSVLASQYDAVGNVRSYTVDGGPEATFTYDGAGRLLTGQYPSGLDLSYTYDLTDAWKRQESSTHGTLERLSDAGGRFTGMAVNGRVQTSYSYDVAGRPIRASGPLGRETRYEYDGFGQLAKTIAANGAETRFERDAAGRVIEQYDALGHRRSTTYHPGGLPATFTDARRHTWTTTHTPRSITTTDPLDRTTVTELDKYGEETRLIHPDGAERTISYLRDVPLGEEGRYVEAIIDEGGHTRRFGYDSSGEQISATDLAGTVYTFDTIGNTTTLNAPNGESVILSADSNFETLEYGDGGVTRFDFTVTGELSRQTYPSGARLDFTYDAFGRQQTRTDSATSEVQTFTWNDADELVQTADALGTTTLDYDSLGNLVRQRVPSGEEIVYQRDLLGRVTDVELWAAGAAEPLRVVTYGYDANDNPTIIEDSEAGVTSLEYDDVDRLTRRVLPNGIVSEYAYDLRDRVTGVTHRAADGVVLLSLTYERNGLGEPSRITREDGSYAQYEYDAAARLTREAYFDAAGELLEERNYTYDLAGNRLTVDDGAGPATYVYDPGFQLRSVTGPGGVESYTYDEDGRLASADRDGETRSFGYATDGKLTAITRPDGVVTYSYDALGRRIRTTGSTGSRRSLVAPTANTSRERPHLITDDSGSILSGYVYVGDEPLLRFADGGETFYLTDAMGSVVGLADTSGTLTATFRYGAFGETRVATGSPAAAAGGDFHFHGSWLDAATGLYHMGVRDYDPRTGRFLTRDPLGPQLERPESTHPYLFAHANPLLYKDPSGLFSIMSVNISLNARSILSTMRQIAFNHVRELAREKMLEALGKIVVNQLLPFVPVDLASIGRGALSRANEVGEFKDFWKEAEIGIQRGICWILGNSSWIYFAPRVESRTGIITHDGFDCPPQGKTRKGPSLGGRFPDFYISSTLPSANSGGLLLGEIKASVKYAYYYWVSKGSGGPSRPEQVEAFNRHVSTYIRSRLFVLVAFNDGHDTMKLELLDKMKKRFVAAIIVALR